MGSKNLVQIISDENSIISAMYNLSQFNSNEFELRIHDAGKKYVLSSKSTQMPLCILYEDTKQITLDLEAFPEGNYVFLNEFYALIPKKYSH